MMILKQSTAATIKLGPFLDDTDGKTAEVALTISQADIRLSKNGGNIAQTNDATGATHDELGFYDVPLDATDTNTLGRLLVAVHESGALPVWREFMVIPANEFDSLISGTDALDVEVASVATAAITADAIAADAIGASELAQAAADQVWSTAARVLTANTNLNDPTAASIADAVWDEAATGHTDAGKAGEQLWTDVNAILADTNELQTDDIPTSIAALPTAVENRTEMDSNSTQLAAIVADTNELQVDDVPGLIAALNDPTAAAVADAVWDEAATGHTDAGKAGEQQWTDIDAILADTNELQTDDIPGSLTTIEGKIDTVDTNVDAVLVDTNELQVDDVPGLIAALNNIAASDVTTDMDANSTQLAAIVADTNELQTDDVPGLIAALNNVSVADILTTQMTEAYAADGAAPTIAQALMLIQQMLGEFAISGTTLTVKKVDGSTGAATFTLDDGTNPTSLTRTT